MDKTIDNIPLVSVLMITYNRAPYIKEAIESVQAQDYSNWELIVMDDASTDATEGIIKKLIECDSRIKYFRQSDNVGIARNRDTSIQHAKGKYLAILDSDDLWSNSKKISLQVQFLETRTDYGVIGTQVSTIDEQGNETGSFDYKTTDELIRKNFLLRNQFTHSSVLFRTGIAGMQYMYDVTLPINEDYDFFLRLGRLTKLANSNRRMTKYRIHAGGITKEKKLIGAKTHFQIMWRYRSDYPNQLSAIAKGLLRVLLTVIKSYKNLA